MNWRSYTQAERDAAYNNAAAVPHSAELVRQRNEASASFRAARAQHLDLPYAASDREKWDLYPAQNPMAPCFIFIHGGYWQMNRREDFAIFAQGALEFGFSAALPGYPLAPEATLTQITSALRTALDWLTDNAKTHGVTTSKFILAGWSAGAHLAALLLDHPIITAGLAISGVFELAPLKDTYLNAKLNLTDFEVNTLSPLRLPIIPKPLAIAFGTRELPALVRDSRALHEIRAAADAPGALIPIAGADHFTVLDGLRKSNSELSHAIQGLGLD